jgi:hypothetical protein
VLALATVAFVAAGLTAEGWRPAWRRLAAILRSPIGLALGGFALLALVSLAWSHRPAQGLAAWGEFVLPMACGAAIMASGRFRPGRRFARALAGAIIVAVVFMMAELATGLSLRGDARDRPAPELYLQPPGPDLPDALGGGLRPAARRGGRDPMGRRLARAARPGRRLGLLRFRERRGRGSASS